MNYLWQRLSYCLLKLSAIIAIPLLAVGPVEAADKQAQERAARKACLNGDYAKGADILSDLFVDTRDPTYIFNQGRCFEQNQRYEEALGRFLEYVRAAGSNLAPDDRAAAEKHISDCKEQLALQRAASTTQPPPQPAVAPSPALAATAPSSEVDVPTAESKNRPTSAQNGQGLLVTGVVVAAVGVASVVGAVVLNLKANSMVGDWETNRDLYTKDKENSRTTYQTLGWVGYGLGAACIATGAVLIGLGARAKANTSRDLAFVPTVGPDQVGAMLKGGF